MSPYQFFRHRLTGRIQLTLVVGLCFAMAASLLALQASAGSITNPGGAPFTKLGVYQGVLVITPVGGGQILEIGNAGRDIASSGDIYLRPGSLSQAASILLTQTSGLVDLIIPAGGAVCLNGTGTPDCKTTWPVAGGAGDIYWETMVSGPDTNLRPHATAAPNTLIRIGKTTAPIPAASGRAAEVFGNSTQVVRMAGTLTTGVQEWDADFNIFYRYGRVLINGNLSMRLDGLLQFYGGSGTSPYDSTNRYRSADGNGLHGTGSNIDADTIDSASVLPFRSKYCTGGTNPGAACPNGNECTGGGTCLSNNLFYQTRTVAGGSLTFLCLRSNDTRLCTGGTNPGTPCPNGTECLGGGICRNMCGADNVTCAAGPNFTKIRQAIDAQAPVNAPTVNVTSNKFCVNKQYARVCIGGSPAAPNGRACESVTDCSAWPGSTCSILKCWNQATCSSPAPQNVTCSVPADCSFWAGSTCTVPANQCYGLGECRTNVYAGSGARFWGNCQRFIECTSNFDCGTGGLCQGYGYCSDGLVGGYDNFHGNKHCEGGTRTTPLVPGGKPICDKERICIGGSGDSKYAQTGVFDDPGITAACVGAGGRIGNAVDYCPGGGTCVPDYLCRDVGDCFADELCTKSIHEGYAAAGTNSCDNSLCDNACGRHIVNRCRGSTNVFEDPLACSTHGSDLQYNDMKVCVGASSPTNPRVSCTSSFQCSADYGAGAFCSAGWCAARATGDGGAWNCGPGVGNACTCQCADGTETPYLNANPNVADICTPRFE